MAPLQTPTDLGGQATKDISAALNLLLADLCAPSDIVKGRDGRCILHCPDHAFRLI
jgi:hypothetical protein